MRSPRLEPVRITDRNGRSTIVYRRAGAGATAKALPSPAAPAADPAPERTGPQREVPFQITAWIAEMITDASPTGTAAERTGTALLTDEDVFAYLSFGAGVDVAAAMHSVHPDPSHWARTPEGRYVAGRRSPSAEVQSFAASVEMMRGLGRTPEDVEAMIVNGLKDEHLRGVLTPEQTAALFTEVRCVRSATKAEDGIDLMVRCLTDGTIPITLVEESVCGRDTLRALARLDLDSRRAEDAGFENSPVHGFHSAAKADPRLWRTMAELIDMREANRTQTGRVWRALLTYGEEDCRRFGTHTLHAVTDTGRSLGAVIREARALGMGDDAIEAAVRAHGSRGSAVLAVARGEATAAVSDGWL